MTPLGAVGMREVLVQLLGLAFLITPLLALQWNLVGRRRRQARLVKPREQTKWRLEIYANETIEPAAIVDRADIPFPVKQVRSAKGELGLRSAENAWVLPRMEYEVNVDDPFTDDVLSGLFGIEHRVRFVTGDEAVIDTRTDQQIRVKAIEFR